MSNTDEFNRCAAHVLSLLHEAFPCPVNINTNDLNEAANRATLEIYPATLTFLADEGFIRIRQQSGADLFQGVVLTAKGLTTLNAVPSAIGGQMPLAVRIKATLAEGSREALRGVIGEIMKIALGL